MEIGSKRLPANSLDAATLDQSVRERAEGAVQDRAEERSGLLVPLEGSPAAEAAALVVQALAL